MCGTHICLRGYAHIAGKLTGKDQKMITKKQIRELYILKEIIEQLECTSSTKDKEEVLVYFLELNPELLSYFKYIYDPYKQFYLTYETAFRKTKKRAMAECSKPIYDLFVLLYKLNARTLGGQFAYNTWINYINHLPIEIQFVAGRILNKDLKCRTGVKILNKALARLKQPLIDIHEVAKGYLWGNEAIWDDKDNWYASRKYDGVRGNIILGKGDPVILSCNGIAFEVFDRLLEEFQKKYNGPPCMFDGELALKTNSTSDDFQGLMKRLRKKNHQIPNACIHCFDWIPLDLDDQKIMKLKYRLDCLDAFQKSMNSDLIIPVKQIRVKGKEHVERLYKKAFVRGWEGIILRRNTPFKNGRSKDIYKIKKKEDGEYKVIGIECGEMNIVKNGKEKTIQILKKAIILVKDCQVGVGSGWSVAQRREFFKYPERIIGKVITVEYDKETKNQKGGYGLRFPVVKWIHGEERES